MASTPATTPPRGSAHVDPVEQTQTQPEVTHADVKDAPYDQSSLSFDALPEDVKLCIGIALGQDAISLASLMRTSHQNYQIFSPFAAVAAAGTLDAPPGAVNPGRKFERLFRYFTADTAAPETASAGNSAEAELAGTAGSQKKRILAPIFDLPRSQGLAGLASSISLLNPNTRFASFKDVLSACAGMSDKNRAWGLAALAEVITILPPEHQDEAFRLLLDATKMLATHRGEVLPRLIPQLSVFDGDDAQLDRFTELLDASIALPQAEERATALFWLALTLTDLADEHFTEMRDRLLHEAGRLEDLGLEHRVYGSLATTIGYLRASPHILTTFRQVLKFSDEQFPADMQPWIEAALASSMYRLGGESGERVFDEGAIRYRAPQMIEDKYDACLSLFWRSDRFNDEGQSLTLSALAKSVFDFEDDPAWVVAMFDAILERESLLQDLAFDTDIKVQLAKSLHCLPSEAMLDRFKTLLRTSSGNTERDMEVRQELEFVIDAMDQADQETANRLLPPQPAAALLPPGL
jgi:hypothetical protein